MKRLSTTLAACLLASGTALAADGEPTLPPQGPQAPDAIKPDGGASGGPTLSEKLEKSDGVLKPPRGIDPEIREVPPQTGSAMPVIKPPGNAR